MEACEARNYGSDSKRKHQVEGAIMQQASVLERLEGARGHEATSKCAREESSQEEERGKSPI
jgi:hypothetical protein